MDDIQKRLQETAQECMETYKAWAGNKKDAKAQEDLHSAIHELRKVSSRLEIELAVSERDQMASKPLPIPPHKSTQKGSKGGPSDDDNMGNGDGPIVQKAAKRRSRAPKK